MRFVQRLALGVLVLSAIATVASAGPNAGGVLVVHAPGIAYSTDNSGYVGQSGVWCGHDDPIGVHTCPPYDPPDGASPCVETAANPTSSKAEGELEVWYVMAAFPAHSCPQLKAVTFRLQYQNVAVLQAGVDDANVFTLYNTDPDGVGGDWPGTGSGVAWSWSGDANNRVVTSHLWELCWFGGYGYAGTGASTFSVVQHHQEGNRFFVDGSTPPVQDAIAGYGTLGFLGTTGTNPTPQQLNKACCIDGTCYVYTLAECNSHGGNTNGNDWCDPDVPDAEECATPVEETTWGRVKHDFSR